MEANPNYIRDVITVLGLEEAKTCDDSECEEDANDRVAGRAGERKTSNVQDSHGKAVVLCQECTDIRATRLARSASYDSWEIVLHVPGTSRHHVQREGDGRKNYLSDPQ